MEVHADVHGRLVGDVFRGRLACHLEGASLPGEDGGFAFEAEEIRDAFA